MVYNERLTEVANAANRYDLTALLEAVCRFDSPGDMREQLLQCYFTIAQELSRSDEGATPEKADALSALRSLIEALGETTHTEEPPLIVVDEGYRHKYEAARSTLEQYAGEMQAAKEKMREAQREAGGLQDIYNDLLRVVADRLTDEERGRHEEFRRRIRRQCKSLQD